jgi:hypothetical protein
MKIWIKYNYVFYMKQNKLLAYLIKEMIATYLILY